MNKTIIIHEICQEIQSSVLVEKWFPNFLHTLINYKLLHQPEEVNMELFPFVNITTDLISKLLFKIDYQDENIDSDISYIIKTIKFIPQNIVKYLDNISYNLKNSNYMFNIQGNELAINQLRISDKLVTKLQQRFPKNNLDDIIMLIVRFSMMSKYSWCSRAITNATTLMLPTTLHSYINSLSNRSLECFSCVINSNSPRYCSLFKDDTVFDGCVGPFMLETLEKHKPDILFANPPYDNGTIDTMIDTLMKYHSNNKALSIITINRKDGGLYDDVSESHGDEYYEGLIKMLSNTESKLLDILVIPSYFMSYELVSNDVTKVLGIKRDTMFILYGDNILDMSIYRLKLNMLNIIKKFRIEHTKRRQRIKYQTRTVDTNKINTIVKRYNLLPTFNFAKSIISNCKMLGNTF